MSDVAIVIRPDEACLLIADWPHDLWLVVSEEAGRWHWDAGYERDLPAMIGTLPVWPPLQGFAVARVAAEREAAMLRDLCAIPDLAAQARKRLSCLPAAEAVSDPLAADIEWDD